MIDTSGHGVADLTSNDLVPVDVAEEGAGAGSALQIFSARALHASGILENPCSPADELTRRLVEAT